MSPPLWHRHQVHGAALSDDGRWLATASHDELARVWDLRDPATPAWSDPDPGFQVSPSGKQILEWNAAEERLLMRDRATGAVALVGASKLNGGPFGFHGRRCTARLEGKFIPSPWA